MLLMNYKEKTKILTFLKNMLCQEHEHLRIGPYSRNKLKFLQQSVPPLMPVHTPLTAPVDDLLAVEPLPAHPALTLKGMQRLCAASALEPSSTHQSNYQDDQCYDEKDVDKATAYVEGEEPQSPGNHQDNKDCS